MPQEQQEISLSSQVASEITGTFLLVLAGTAVATAAILDQPIAGMSLDSLAVGLTFGLALFVLAASLGHISGHFNPAVTLALATIHKLPCKYILPYIISQFVGAILAGVAVWLTYGNAARENASLAATYPTLGHSEAQAFLIEALATFILVLVITAVATDERASKASASAAIGFALGIGVMIAGPISGGAVNPARALGPMIVAGKFTSFWVYLTAPVLGGILAALLYHHVLSKTRRLEEP